MINDKPLGRFAKCTFGNFKNTLQPDAYKSALKMANGKLKGLLLIGPVGVGKTHLAAAVFNKIGNETLFLRDTDNLGNADFHPRTRYITEVDLLGRIRETYQKYSELTEGQILNLYKATPFLILDDICKYTPQDPSFRNRIYFNIVDWRWSREYPMMFTSNNTVAELTEMLGPPVVDRITDMCEIVILKGKSQRGQH